MPDSVGQYLHEIGQVPLIDAQAERDLAQKIELGRAAKHVLLAVGVIDPSQPSEVEATPDQIQADAVTPIAFEDAVDQYAVLHQSIKGITIDTLAFEGLKSACAGDEQKQVASRLRREIRQGERAKDMFVRSNLRLVVSMAKRYPLPPGMEVLDLIQDGNIGLAHAVEKFDWRKGFKFSTYATWWIRQSIGRALDQKGTLIRLPTQRSTELRAALRVVDGEADDLPAELSYNYRLATPLSLDHSIQPDEEAYFHDIIPYSVPGPEQAVVELDSRYIALESLNDLEPREKIAIEIRFGFRDGQNHSFREVGEVLGVTAERARRIVKRATDKLKSDDALSGLAS